MYRGQLIRNVAGCMKISLRVDRPHAFDCRKSLVRNRNVENLAAQKSEITDRLYVSPKRKCIRNLQSAEPLYADVFPLSFGYTKIPFVQHMKQDGGLTLNNVIQYMYQLNAIV